MSGNAQALDSVIRMLGRVGPGDDAGSGRAGQARAERLKSAAFAAQLEMARNICGPKDQVESAGGAGLGLVGDSLMFDALSTISRLIGDQDLPLSGAGPGRTARAAQGGLSALFESGDKGPGAVGFDRVGGTSYGIYQISSRAGTMDRFLAYLDRHEPQWAERLRAAGPANTGSTTGAMPDEWQRLAQENPERFARLQHEFIRQDHYLPALEKIMDQTGVDLEKAPFALREALWSTSVQHGPSGAARIFNKVIEDMLGREGGADFGRELVDRVYSLRVDRFGSSTGAVRQSVAGRLDREKELILAMLDGRGVDRVV
ncbi:MAG: hypothetical protein PHV85_01735 [Desulfovibrionaceae bacterium]|nr:hypothetical protein [Desulfovibrionaceae bacterium]